MLGELSPPPSRHARARSADVRRVLQAYKLHRGNIPLETACKPAKREPGRADGEAIRHPFVVMRRSSAVKRARYVTHQLPWPYGCERGIGPIGWIEPREPTKWHQTRDEVAQGADAVHGVIARCDVLEQLDVSAAFDEHARVTFRTARRGIFRRSTIECAPGFAFEARASALVTVVWARGLLHIHGPSIDHHGSEALLLPRDQEFRGTWDGSRLEVLSVDADDLRAIAAEEPASGPVTIDRRTVITAVLDAQLRAAVALADRIEWSGEWRVADVRVAHAAERALASTLLAAFTNGTAAAEAITAPRERSLRLALAYLELHAAQPLTLDAVAAAAGVSVRTLQSRFRSELRTTPLLHLRTLRLERVRAELQVADRDGETIAAIARRNGFGHLGHFARVYREAFGELPRETLSGGDA